jgi:hypothetical protein
MSAQSELSLIEKTKDLKKKFSAASKKFFADPNEANADAALEANYAWASAVRDLMRANPGLVTKISDQFKDL